MLNCGEIQNYLGDAIDKALPEHVKEKFHSHLEVCRSCRNAYELEALAKSLVQDNIKRISTPPAVHAAVKFSLQQEYKQSTEHKNFIERIFGSQPLLPTLATGVALAAFLYFFVLPTKNDSRSESSHSAANDIMNQTLRNFSLVRSGELQPKMISCFPEAVQDFFVKNGFASPVKIVKLSNCDWYGAGYSEYGGVKIAHIMYKMEEETLYVFQVKQDDVIRSSILGLPPAAKKELALSGWYTDPSHGNDCNIIVWIEDGTLCAASSTMKKDKLLAVLTTP